MNIHSPIHDITEARMTSLGEVVIPQALRDRAGLTPGSSVRVGINDRGEVVILPAESRAAETPEERRARIAAALEAIAGKYKTGQTTEEYMAEIRGPYEPE